jgi:hypothetical protein
LERIEGRKATAGDNKTTETRQSSPCWPLQGYFEGS